VTFEEAASILTEFVAVSLGRTLPRDVTKLILVPLNLWSSRKEAEHFRLEARKAMQSTVTTDRGGWYYLHYGNCGIQSFVEGGMFFLIWFSDNFDLKTNLKFVRTIAAKWANYSTHHPTVPLTAPKVHRLEESNKKKRELEEYIERLVNKSLVVLCGFVLTRPVERRLLCV
jgi:hypothetical protein